MPKCPRCKRSADYKYFDGEHCVVCSQILYIENIKPEFDEEIDSQA